MSAPPPMRGLVAVLGNLTDAALKEAFRHVALKTLGRPVSAAAGAKLDGLLAVSFVSAQEKEPFLAGCEFLLKQAQRPGVTLGKLEGRLSPLGFTAAHLEVLQDSLTWINQGASDTDGGAGLPDLPADYAEPSEEAERQRVDGLIAAQLGDGSDSDASLESDDDDEYSSSSDSSEDEDEQAEDDEKDDLAHVEEKMLQVKLPIGEAMRMISEKTDAFLHRLLRLTLRHMLRQSLTPAEMNKLERHAVDEMVGLDELPSLLQHLRALLTRAGMQGNFKSLRLALLEDKFGPFDDNKVLIMQGACRRWGREIKRHRREAKAARAAAAASELSMDGYLNKRGSFTIGGSRINIITGAIDACTGAAEQLIQVELPHRTYVLSAESSTQHDAWYRVLSEGAQRYKRVGIFDDDDADDDTGRSTELITGYLEKQGEKNKQFKKRWCVLNGVALSYYKSEGAPKKAGLFHIGGAEVSVTGEDMLTIHIQLPHRLYVLRGENGLDIKEWVAAFDKAQQQFKTGGAASGTGDETATASGAGDSGGGQADQPAASTAETASTASDGGKAVPEGVPPAKHAVVDVLGTILPAPSPEMVHASLQTFDVLEIVRKTGEVDEEREVMARVSVLGLAIVCSETGNALDFYPTGCMLAMDDEGSMNQGKLRTLRLKVKPRRCLEEQKATKTKSDPSLIKTLYFVMKDTSPLSAALVENRNAARQHLRTTSLDVCADEVVRSLYRDNPGIRTAAFKEGMLEKLGEGGMRGKLGRKKWQWRLLSLNEETLAWYSKNSAGSGDETAEMTGCINIADIEKVWATAGKAKGRPDNQCLQIQGAKLPHA